MMGTDQCFYLASTLKEKSIKEWIITKGVLNIHFWKKQYLFSSNYFLVRILSEKNTFFPICLIEAS